MKKTEKKRVETRGRPKISPELRRDQLLDVRFSARDKQIIREQADKSSKTLAEFVRERLGI